MSFQKTSTATHVLRMRTQVKACCKALVCRIGCLISFREGNEAFSGPDAQHWKTAMSEEMNSLREKKTWNLVYRPPKAKVVKNR